MGKQKKASKNSSKGGYTFKNAAYEILKEYKRPMNAKEMTKTILKRGMVQTDGKTPDRTLSALLYNEIRKKKEDSLFVIVDKGIFALSENEDNKAFNRRIHLIDDFPKIASEEEESGEYDHDYGYLYLKYYLFLNAGKTNIRRKKEKVCFICKNSHPPAEKVDDQYPSGLIGCKRCEKKYHMCCLEYDGKSFYCPRHVCHKCGIKLKKKHSVRCLTCPLAYCRKCTRGRYQKGKRGAKGGILKLVDEKDLVICEHCLPFYKKEIETTPLSPSKERKNTNKENRKKQNKSESEEEENEKMENEEEQEEEEEEEEEEESFEDDEQ